MRAWSKIEWPAHSLACIVTRAHLEERGYQGDIRAGFLFVVQATDPEEDEIIVWIDSADRLREFLGMAAPRRWKIQAASDEDTSALVEWLTLDQQVH